MTRSDHRLEVTPGGRTVAASTTVGVLVVIGAFVALVVAGINVADTLAAAGDVARDTGVFRAITAWATPLGLLGVATLFAVAIPAALARVRGGIGERRDALVESLPRLIAQR